MNQLVGAASNGTVQAKNQKYSESFYHNICFSGYRNAILKSEEACPIATSFLEEMESIQNGDHKEVVEEARRIKNSGDENAYKKFKNKVWCFSAGVNTKRTGRAAPLFEEFTGLLTLDIDNPNEDPIKNKEILKTFDWVLAVGKSIGGDGLFAIVKCDPKRLTESYESAEKLLSNVGITVENGKEPNRLRYTSYDPDIYYCKAPGLAPPVPIISTVEKKSTPLKLLQNNNQEDIFKTIVRVVKRENPEWDENHRHDPLIKIASWCNAVGMSEDYCLKMADEFIRPIMYDGNQYPIIEQIKDIYKRYADQHNSKEWKGQAEEQIPMKSLADFEQYRITKEKLIPETPAVITIGNARVAAAGNITPITAESKAGKSAAASVFIAGAISRCGEVEGFTDVAVKPNPDGKAVIHFDTEQSPADQQYNIRTVLKRAKIYETPDYYLSYNIRTLALSLYRGFAENVCKHASEQFRGIQLIVVDGSADFITSVNDEAEANAIILFFTQLAVRYECPVILIVHLNENAGKNADTMPRGHLGRQAVRKGYAQLNIVKEGDVSIMQVLRARKAGNADTPLVAFKYDQEKGYHVSTDAEAVKEEKSEKKDLIKNAKLRRIAEKVFTGTTSHKRVDAIDKIRQVTSKGAVQAGRDLQSMKVFGMVSHEDDLYRLNLNYKP